jgi:EF-P beta-lysylation protein EpmB
VQAPNNKPKGSLLSDTAWQAEITSAVSDPAELLSLLKLSPDLLPPPPASFHLFPMRVPRGYVARMRKEDPKDPLLLQVWPGYQNPSPRPDFSPDPVGDLSAMPVPGLLHKYQGRVLLITTGACPIHCRYCFRQHFPYSSANAAGARWNAALDYIAERPSVSEVILSGGDPLMLSDSRLADLVRALAGIAHVQRVRIHTRLPVAVPSRVADGLLDALAGTRLKPVMVLHANHANEIDQRVETAFARAAARGVTLLNQSVLLRGVNDCAETLVSLSERLFNARVLPYYLHLLDRVQGAAHFDVDEAEAARLMAEVHRRLPGFLVPRLVRERRGASAKQPLEVVTEPVEIHSLWTSP